MDIDVVIFEEERNFIAVYVDGKLFSTGHDEAGKSRLTFVKGLLTAIWHFVPTPIYISFKKLNKEGQGLFFFDGRYASQWPDDLYSKYADTDEELATDVYETCLKTNDLLRG